MSTVTLVEARKLALNEGADLKAGVIQGIIDVNPIFSVMPFTEISGNSITFNRENVAGNAEVLPIGAQISAVNPATFTKTNAALTTLIGQAEVNGLIQATMSDLNDQASTQIASKSRTVARLYQDKMINGDPLLVNGDFEGLSKLVPLSQTVAHSDPDGGLLTFDLLDEMLDKVRTAAPQFLLLSVKAFAQLRALMRNTPGNSAEYLQISDSVRVPVYGGVPVFKSDFIREDEVTGQSAGTTSVYAGTFDDGSFSHGLVGITPRAAAGIVVEALGKSQTADNDMYRVKWYTGLASPSANGLARLTGIKVSNALVP